MEEQLSMSDREQFIAKADKVYEAMSDLYKLWCDLSHRDASTASLDEQYPEGWSSLDEELASLAAWIGHQRTFI